MRNSWDALTEFQRSGYLFYLLFIVQRSIRLFIRCTWLFLSGYLCGWSINTIWGGIPGVLIWQFLGILFITPFIWEMFHPPSVEALFWQADRRLNLKEQMSAAWQETAAPEHSTIVNLLQQDAAQLFKTQTKRLLQVGWHIGNDLTALFIVGILFFSVRQVQAFQSPLLLTSVPRSTLIDQLPPLSAERAACEWQAGADQELTGSASPVQSRFNMGDPARLGETLNQLGQRLSQQVETRSAGSALQAGDFPQAAREFEALADQVAAPGQLSSEGLTNLQAALAEAAVSASLAGEDEFAAHLQNAAEQLAAQLEGTEDTSAAAADSLDNIAMDLRDLTAQLLAAGDIPPDVAPAPGEVPDGQPVIPPRSAGGASLVTGASQPGISEPFVRLEGEADRFEFAGGELPSALASPGTTEQSPPAGDPGPGLIQPGAASDIARGTAPLLFYQFPWKWRYVIQAYFLP